MICSLFLGFLDQRAERILKREASATGETVRLTDVKDFKATFWLITVVCVAYYVAIFPFIGLAKYEEFYNLMYNLGGLKKSRNQEKS